MTEFFEVEQILASKKRKGKTFYKIRWKTFGPEDDTWEPLSHLRGCQELVREFESKKTTKTETGPSPVVGRSSSSNVVARTPRTLTKTNVSLTKSVGADGDGLTVRERVDYSRRSLHRSALRSQLPVENTLQGSALRSKQPIQDTPKMTLIDGPHIKRTTVTSKKITKEVSAKTKQEDSSISPAVAVLCVFLIILVLVFVYFTS